MSLDTLKNKLPDYAKDMRLNLGGITNTPSMTTQQLWGTILASAYVSGQATVIKILYNEAKNHLTEDALSAVKTAVSLMNMNNIYYRFIHLIENEHYSQMPARLRMNAISNPGVDKLDFELWSLAISAINGCGMCIKAHEKTLTKDGAQRETIQDSIRIASIIHSLARTLNAEEALKINDKETAKVA